MRNSKLIIVAGMSGCGKSTTAQQLSKQLECNGIKHLWMHEEIENHPIRDGEFKVGSLHTEKGMAANVTDMYSRWERLVEEIDASGSVYVMEGCLYQMIIRYFFTANYPHEKITQFYDRIMQIMSKLNPTIVFVYRTDVKASFEQAFEVRGERWKKIILDPEGDGYFTTHEYRGDESTYAMYEHYQQVANAMFERYQGSKIRLNTSDCDWGKHHQQLCAFLGLRYFPPQAPPPLLNLEQYCGRYTLDIDGQAAVVTIKVVDGGLYCQMSWWSNMKLISVGNHEFEALSFPIRFAFAMDEGKRSVTVKGNYGWGISGKTLFAE